MGRHEKEHGHHDENLTPEERERENELHGTAETRWRDDLQETTPSSYEHGTTAHTPGTPGRSGPSAETGSARATPGTPGAGGTTVVEEEADGTAVRTSGAALTSEELAYEHGTTEHTPGAPGAATVRDPEDEAKYEHGTTEHTPGAPGASKRHD
ncbi:hypothetical protein [Aquipuribacter nitratireducens]|uniref:Uncharacterized protein n=1 Tax=Aquipuribacter nitratireducens TaxID=650104 RepID=A0ABW0GUL0_9MICO